MPEEQLDFLKEPKKVENEPDKKPEEPIKPVKIPCIPRRGLDDGPDCALCEIYGPRGCPRHKKDRK